MYYVYRSFYFVDFNYHQFKEAYFDDEHNMLIIPHSIINTNFSGFYMNYPYSDEQHDLFITKVLNDEYDEGKGEDWLR